MGSKFRTRYDKFVADAEVNGIIFSLSVAVELVWRMRDGLRDGGKLWTAVVRSTILAIGPYEGYEWRSRLSADRLD
jgi:hypothetical protein